MPNDAPDLDELRRQIDAIDADMHEKIVQRIALIDQVAKAKERMGGAAHAMRPNREAAMARELAERHEGQLQTASVIRIWRELINGATALQGPFSVAVCAPERSVGYWDMARNHFGSSVPMTLHTSATLVLRLVDEEPGAIGLLPLPQNGEDAPWWPALASQADGASGPRVIWRLPFFASATGQFERLEALAVAKLTPEASGNDATLVAVETDRDVSLARVIEQLSQCGFTPHPMAVQELGHSSQRLQLIELDGLVSRNDKGMVAFHEKLGDDLSRVAILGAYPRALAAEQLEPSR
ncbi:MAG: chorismate mutase [Rhodospirillaceae bacterium]|jgi:chorismate mutase / prephenate dehydratase|nr:chorismate mutase [Rhodospirillaceae bacterium]MBT4491475.1 chorismate mutase [Rhodospirillaceae bacterium]MBT5192724.1 chorismate mutase [Rhodospirillaceae bacterium]MBT6426210.1 chorismate mutase [Rhodospirillaceae bacterium]MBT7759074.1 chorismate mutase [Rhodospirillaceae bacterium]